MHSTFQIEQGQRGRLHSLFVIVSSHTFVLVLPGFGQAIDAFSHRFGLATRHFFVASDPSGPPFLVEFIPPHHQDLHLNQKREQGEQLAPLV